MMQLATRLRSRPAPFRPHSQRVGRNSPVSGAGNSDRDISELLAQHRESRGQCPLLARNHSTRSHREDGEEKGEHHGVCSGVGAGPAVVNEGSRGCGSERSSIRDMIMFCYIGLFLQFVKKNPVRFAGPTGQWSVSPQPRPVPRGGLSSFVIAVSYVLSARKADNLLRSRRSPRPVSSTPLVVLNPVHDV
jgi:hypothetical protein